MKQSLQSINKAAALAASAALKEMFKKDVKVKIPLARVANVRRLKPAIALEEMTVGIYLPITGDLKGAALLVIPREGAFAISDMMLKREQGFTRKLTRLDKAALKEVGNIICGRYLTVFANRMGIKTIEHIPNFTCSTFGSIISDIIAKFSRFNEEALIVEVNLIFKPKVMKVYFLMLFEPISITQLIK